jgi:hypothetical protein
MVLVCSGPVMVFGMIVIGVDMRMQRGNLADGEDQRHHDQDR